MLLLWCTKCLCLTNIIIVWCYLVGKILDFIDHILSIMRQNTKTRPLFQSIVHSLENNLQVLEVGEYYWTIMASWECYFIHFCSWLLIDLIKSILLLLLMMSRCVIDFVIYLVILFWSQNFRPFQFGLLLFRSFPWAY